MKKCMIIGCAAIFAMGCSNQATSKESTTAAPIADSSTEKIDYAYLPQGHPPDNWQPGDQKNVAMVLKSLKGFENGNVDEAMVPFADSVRWTMDNFDAKMSKDSLKTMLAGELKRGGSTKIIMDDYESVISKDKKEEYVTLWYKQINTDKTGKKDSAVMVDDLKIEKGKIVLLDEKSRKFPVKK